MVLTISEENLFNLFDHSSDGIIVLDAKGTIVRLNPVAKKFIQSEGDDFLFCHESHICVDDSGEDICEHLCPVRQVLKTRNTVKDFYFSSSINLGRFLFPATCMPLTVDENDGGNSGESSGLAVLIFQDTSMESMFKEQLLVQSRQDLLTGLHNRTYFDELLQLEVRRLHKHGGSLAGAMLEIVDLKKVNAKSGTSAGDLLIKEVGNIIKGTLRQVDISCRYSGGKFGIVFIGTSDEGAKRSLERLRCNLDSMQVEGLQKADINVTIGMASTDSQYDTLLEQAEGSLS